MNKRNALIFLSILGILFTAMPLIVILRTIHLKSGYKGLVWGRTEQQVQSWIKKNNNKAVLNRCNLSHFGVSCYKLTWKDSSTSPFEYIEFQFKDGKLVAVVETGHKKDYTKNIAKEFGQPDFGTDIAVSPVQKEKGQRYQLTDRIFYYSASNRLIGTKSRIALECLIKNVTNDTAIPEETLFYRITTGYYSPDYYDQAKSNTENFPSLRFLKQ